MTTLSEVYDWIETYDAGGGRWWGWDGFLELIVNWSLPERDANGQIVKATYNSFNGDVHHYTPYKPIDADAVETPLGELEIVDHGPEHRKGTYTTKLWKVFRIGDLHLKISGVYQSYDGTNWDRSLEVVHSVEKTISVWEKK